jgi:hypothetical protein
VFQPIKLRRLNFADKVLSYGEPYLLGQKETKVSKEERVQKVVLSESTWIEMKPPALLQ